MSESEPVKHFLIRYLAPPGRLIECTAYNDWDSAYQFFSGLEVAYADMPEMQVVLLSADSLETVMRTHGHYFASPTAGLPEFRGIRPAGGDVVDERDKLLTENGRLRAVVTETLDLMRLRAEGRPVSIGEAHILVAHCRGALEVPSE